MAIDYAVSPMEELLSDAFAAKLQKLAEQNAAAYQSNKPFPFMVFDDFLPLAAAEAALRDFPQPKQLTWTKFENQMEKKLAFDSVEKLPEGDRNVLYFLNSRPMLKFLEILTGIKGIVPDPYFEGGGLHQIIPGGKLGVHADFNHHPRLNLDRRINVLIYLNKDWDESYGGHFELWNRDMTQAEQKILPLFNRCAIFSTTSWSFHGHPTPLSCPPDRTRKSVATYYYTNGRPEEEKTDSHSTLFQLRPGETADGTVSAANLGRGNVSTEAMEAPQAKQVQGVVVKEPWTMRRIAWALTPPILHEMYKKAVGR